MKRFERSNGLDTALYKNYLYLYLLRRATEREIDGDTERQTDGERRRETEDCHPRNTSSDGSRLGS